MSILRSSIAFGALMLSSAALAQSAKPTDPQIAHIAYTAGVIDIEAAELAQKRSKNKAVLSFAADMVRDHKAVNAQALALVGKLKITPEDNPTSKALSKQAEAKLKELSALEGAAFDRAYAQNEVAYHRQVNEALQSTLVPAATNGELKTLLTTGLRIFQGHQKHAEQVVGELK